MRRVLEWLSFPVVALGLVSVLHSDESIANGLVVNALPTLAALGLMIVILGLVQESGPCEGRRSLRHHRSRHRRSRWWPRSPGRALSPTPCSVEVVLPRWSSVGMDCRACHTVTLQVGSGGWAWSLRHGRRPGLALEEWYVQSRNPAVVESLDRSERRRSWRIGTATSSSRSPAELEPPRVHYDPDRGRLSYVVVVAGGRMTSLTLEQFTAQLDLLRRLAELDRRANPPVR